MNKTLIASIAAAAVLLAPGVAAAGPDGGPGFRDGPGHHLREAGPLPPPGHHRGHHKKGRHHWARGFEFDRMRPFFEGFRLFHDSDADRDGALNKDELAAMTAKVNEAIARREKNAVAFDAADADKNGSVTLDELALIVPKPEFPKAGPRGPEKPAAGDGPRPLPRRLAKDGPRGPEGKPGPRGPEGKFGPGPRHRGPFKNPAYFIMARYDADGDLKLGPEEYASFGESVQQRIAAEKQAAEVLQKADFNGDGFVTEKELRAAYKSIRLQNAPKFDPKQNPVKTIPAEPGGEEPLAAAPEDYGADPADYGVLPDEPAAGDEA